MIQGEFSDCSKVETSKINLHLQFQNDLRFIFCPQRTKKKISEVLKKKLFFLQV